MPRNNTRLHDSSLEFDIAIQLEQCRIDKGLRRSEVAERVGVSYVCVYKWEEGSITPCSFARYKRWAKAVGAEFNVFLKVPA